jgi:hypothetical protein
MKTFRRTGTCAEKPVAETNSGEQARDRERCWITNQSIKR